MAVQRRDPSLVQTDHAMGSRYSDGYILQSLVNEIAHCAEKIYRGMVGFLLSNTDAPVARRKRLDGYHFAFWLFHFCDSRETDAIWSKNWCHDPCTTASRIGMTRRSSTATESTSDGRIRASGFSHPWTRCEIAMGERSLPWNSCDKRCKEG